MKRSEESVVPANGWWMLLVFCLASCASLQQFAMTPEERQEHAAMSCSHADDKTWNLGTGRALDVRRKAQGFWALRAERWVPPNQPLLMEDAVKEAVGLSKANRRRHRSLELASGLTQQSTQVDDLNVVDFVPEGDVGHRFRVFTVGEPQDPKRVYGQPQGEVALLATVGECPRVVAESTCKDGTLKTIVTVDGKVPCMGPFTVGLYVDIDLGDGSPRRKLPFGEPLQLPGGQKRLSFRVFQAGSDLELGEVTRDIDEFSDPVPAEALAALSLDREDVAARLYENLSAATRTDELKVKITEARVARARAFSGRPGPATRWLTTMKIGTLPGDPEVLRITGERIGSALTELGRDETPTSEKFRVGASLVRFVRAHSSETAAAADEGLSVFEAHYGPLFVKAKIDDQKDWEAFIELYPRSKYSAELKDIIGQLDRLAVANASAERIEKETDQLWDDVRSKGDSLAELAFKISFAQKHFDPGRVRRSLENMRAYRALLIENTYCPAKKAFVDGAGAAEFIKRGAQHCKEEPPTSSGLAGATITLTDECRAAFATGC